MTQVGGPGSNLEMEQHPTNTNTASANDEHDICVCLETGGGTVLGASEQRCETMVLIPITSNLPRLLSSNPSTHIT